MCIVGKKENRLYVITVVRNDVKHIVETLESVQRQSRRDVVCIVQDGESTDGTREVIEEYALNHQNVYWWSEPDRGVYDGMNKALEHLEEVAGPETDYYVNFMNSGDVFHSDTVVEEMRLEEISEDDVIVYGNVFAKYWDGNVVEKPRPFFSTPMKFKGVGINHQTMFFSRKTLVGAEYDLQYKIAADYDLVYRLWKKGTQFVYRDVTVADYEWGNGISSNPYKLLDVYRENARVCGEQWHPLYWAKLGLEYYRLIRKR